MLTSTKEIHIEWGDCDPLGIVYFPRYFEFFDACTNALFEKAGFPKPELLKKFRMDGIPMVDVRAKFMEPSAFGDTVRVESRVAEWGRSSFSVEHKLYRGEVLAVEGWEKRVWVVRTEGEGKKIRSAEIPMEVKERFEKKKQ
jgi:4-hydroxybenzoyl-CoA thioesterase